MGKKVRRTGFLLFTIFWLCAPLAYNAMHPELTEMEIILEHYGWVCLVMAMTSMGLLFNELK